jgi:hypothetical protein
MNDLTLGPFAVDPDGILRPLDPGALPALHFAWRGRACDAELDGTWLRLASAAARIPSSAEPGADRSRAFAELAGLPALLPRGWTVKLLADHRVQLEAEAQLETPPTATSLIAAMVRFALALDPYLDRLENAGVR